MPINTGSYVKDLLNDYTLVWKLFLTVVSLTHIVNDA